MKNRRDRLFALLPVLPCFLLAMSGVGCGSTSSQTGEEIGALDDTVATDGGKATDAGKAADGGPASDGGKGHDAGPTDGGETTDGGGTSDAGPALTWTTIYDEAFAPGTPGHCGNSGCHETTLSGFACGTTAASCLAGMISKGLLSTTNPTGSTLGSTTASPLRWVRTGGPMPADNTAAEPALGADIEAWVKAGAPGIVAN
jgi:hypothetical protein